MKLYKWCSLILFNLVSISQISANENVVFFAGNVEEAKVKAKKENKLYFIEFMAKWCEPCQWMEENTFSNPALAGYIPSHYVPVKVDVENLDGFVWKQKYKVQYLPTIVVLTADGTILGKYEKSMNASDLLRILKSHRGSPVSAETELLAKENIPASVTPVKTNPSSEAKPVFITVRNEPGLPKASEVTKKPNTPKAPATAATAAATIFNTSPVKKTNPETIKNTDPTYGSEFRIQVGVYSDAINATNAVARLKKDFTQTVQIFNKKDISTNTVTYRVTIGKFTSREEAIEFVNELKSRGIQGVIKQGIELK